MGLAGQTRFGVQPVDLHLLSLSLQEEAHCEDAEDNLKRVTFSRSPVMSSYLLAFVIGEYDCIKQHDSNVRVYTPVGKSRLGQFALDVSFCTAYHNNSIRP